MFAFDSAEGRLLRLGCSPAGDGVFGALEGVDWERVIATARAHGVAPLLATRLAGRAPEGPREELRAELRRSVASALLHERILREVAVLAGGAGIDLIVLKGQALSLEAWGGIGLRPSLDVDVLVRHGDAGRLAGLLRDAGWHLAMDLTPDEWRRVLRTHPEWSLWKDGSLDLHWTLVAREGAFALGTDEIFRASRTIDVGGLEARTLSLPHLVLFLAVHGCKHFWERFEWIASFHAIASKEGIDWDETWALARRLRAARRLTIALHLAARCFGGEAGVPGDRAALENVEWTVSRWFARSPAPERGSERQRVAAPTFDTRADAWRSWLAAVFQPRVSDWRELPLPDSLAFLYPLLRPVRLILRRLQR
jgi:hypothetical protein